jgi:hypothetical protein
MSSNQLDPKTMAQAQQASMIATPGSREYDYMVRQSAWVAWVNFAGVMLIMLGTLHAIQGLVALFRDEVYVVGKSGLVVNVDYTTWGWVHIVWGLLGILVGVCLLAGQMWARVVGVILAFASAIINVGFLPSYPVWSGIMIALDVIVIWAITVHGGELKEFKQ